MKEQLLISVGREFGSGGHEIAEKLAKNFGIKLYDRNLLDQMFEGNKKLTRQMDRFDEQLPKMIIHRRVRGFSNSMEENLAHMQFDFIKKEAEKGESFVIVGRCGETVLRDYKELASFFILGSMEDRILRIMKKYHLSKKDAISKIERHDSKRKKYHNLYADWKWGDSRGYDLCINSGWLGVDGTVRILSEYINARREI